MAAKKIEDGIRTYLESIGGGDRPVVNREAVKALKSQVRSETDVLAKAKLLSRLEEEEAGHLPDYSGDRAVFVAEAKAWAEQEGITVGALQVLGVPDDVLKQAGFDLPATTDRLNRAAAKPRPKANAARAPRIPLDEVLAQAEQLGRSWKLTDLAAALKREPMTVRNYVTKLVEAGKIQDLGHDPQHDGRGRAAKVYGLPPQEL